MENLKAWYEDTKNYFLTNPGKNGTLVAIGFVLGAIIF